MNTNQEKSKNSVIKTLAIIGLISIVVLVVWASVQFIRFIPSAFSSLASVAETIYSNRPVSTLTVATEKNIVNAGESFRISWTDLEQEGEYSFYYTCTEGVSVDIRRGGGETETVQCGDPAVLPDDDTSLDVIVYSERRRFIDVPFTIAFTQAQEDEPLFERNSSVTIVNATIPQSVDVAIENGEEPDEEAEEEVSEGEAETPAATRPSAGTPTEAQEVVSYIPQSHPDGFTDLKITYLGVGVFDNDEFRPAASMDSDERGAIRFEVKNIGTKTSEDWTFEATLPTGAVFESDEQEGLRPNERAVYTLGFSVTGVSGFQEIGAELSVPDETNPGNNSFEWSVNVVD